MPKNHHDLYVHYYPYRHTRTHTFVHPSIDLYTHTHAHTHIHTQKYVKYYLIFPANHINIAERAANMVSGLSTLTRRVNKGIQSHNKAAALMSKSTSEPMNLITDQSPG